MTHWKISWCWERLKVGGEGDNRKCDGWMALLTWWQWVWASSRSLWCTGKPGIVLQSMGLQRVRHDWVTELSWLKSEKVGRSSSWNRVLLKDCKEALKKSLLWFYVPEIQRMELGCGDVERLMVGKFLALSFSGRKVFSGSLQPLPPFPPKRSLGRSTYERHLLKIPVKETSKWKCLD